MRPPAEPQDRLRAPLNELLGAEGNVRVLRVVSTRSGALGRTAVAREARLNPRGVRTILDRLALAGIVDVQQSGRTALVRMRDAHPLAGAVRRLFEEEQAFFEGILRRLREAVRETIPEVRAVWLTAGRSLATADVGVLAPPKEVDRAVHALETRLREAGRDLAVHFTIRAYTDGERELIEASGAPVTLAWGWLPVGWRAAGGGGALRSHGDLDERGRRLAALIARRIAEDPSIIDRAIEWIDRRERAQPEGANRELAEWRSLLTSLSARQVEAMLGEDSERADRLRQSLPFLDVLTPEERAAVFREVA